MEYRTIKESSFDRRFQEESRSLSCYDDSMDEDEQTSRQLPDQHDLACGERQVYDIVYRTIHRPVELLIPQMMSSKPDCSK